jgi:hypothetical protein
MDTLLILNLKGIYCTVSYGMLSTLVEFLERKSRSDFHRRARRALSEPNFLSPKIVATPPPQPSLSLL